MPVGLASRLAMRLGTAAAPRLSGTDRLEKNLAVVGVPDPRDAARRGIGFYARYWVDTFRLPQVGRQVVDRRFGFVGYHHILDVQAAGATPIMVLPHLGSWEWAAAWLGLVDGQKVVAVVEDLEPEEVFEWFRETRESYGVKVVPLGPNSFRTLMSEVKMRDSIICLLADRDISGSGVEVTLFGRATTLP
ncbi:MAG: hypothetical protein HKN24_06770, partial [Acidimicrobiales bacterium]|nr:hypothetical protein [Acidimicrobiales bacterium]